MTRAHWRRLCARRWLAEHDISPRAATTLVVVLAVAVLYLGHRMGV